MKKIIITGGGGYVGSALVPYLIQCGYDITVLDLFLYGKDVFGKVQNSPYLHLIQGDIRDSDMLHDVFKKKDILIHLACISNDPSFDLNPRLGKSINYDAFKLILKELNQSDIQRFIYASSSSVYGVRDETNVIETTLCQPLTDYSKYKLLCEKELYKNGLKNTCFTIIRPATVCGYAPRLRLDLSVNILTIQALVLKAITVFGGKQLRPHIYIQDMIEAYRLLLEAPEKKISGEIFNVGYENRSICSTAELIQKFLLEYDIQDIQIDYKPTNDLRSYHIDSQKIKRILGFKPQYQLQDAVSTIAKAYFENKIKHPLENTLYYNIKRMKEINLQ